MLSKASMRIKLSGVIFVATATLLAMLLGRILQITYHIQIYESEIAQLPIVSPIRDLIQATDVHLRAQVAATSASGSERELAGAAAQLGSAASILYDNVGRARKSGTIDISVAAFIDHTRSIDAAHAGNSVGDIILAHRGALNRLNEILNNSINHYELLADENTSLVAANLIINELFPSIIQSQTILFLAANQGGGTKPKNPELVAMARTSSGQLEAEITQLRAYIEVMRTHKPAPELLQKINALNDLADAILRFREAALLQTAGTKVLIDIVRLDAEIRDANYKSWIDIQKFVASSLAEKLEKQRLKLWSIGGIGFSAMVIVLLLVLVSRNLVRSFVLHQKLFGS